MTGANPQHQRRAVAVVADLMFSSRIEANAGSGWHVDVAPDTTTAERALATSADLVLVDLHTPGIDIAAIVAAAGRAPVVAFGRHTDAPALRAARLAGCARVLPRSDFVAELAGYFTAGVPA